MLKLNIVRQPVEKEEIRMDQTPTQSKWALIPLYKPTINGEMLYWQIEFNGYNKLIRSYGHDNEVSHTDDIEVNKEQALSEARRQYKLKYKEGYQSAGVSTPPMIKGMKGDKYNPNTIKNWPVYTQPKLHGIRMLSQDVGMGRLTMRSWLNNSFDHLTHLEPELREFFMYLPRYSTLDGELYNHNMTFSTLTSAVKTIKSIHPNLTEIQYWIFDIIYEDHLGTPYERRYELLVNAYNKYIEDMKVMPKTFFIVPSQLARNNEEVLTQHNYHVENGFEGIMIKKISNGVNPSSKLYTETLYKSGKNNHILKYKQFIDEEVTIVDVNINDFIVQDKTDNTFSVPVKRLQNLSDVKGKQLTIRYQELLTNGIPNSPIAVAIRDYE